MLYFSPKLVKSIQYLWKWTPEIQNLVEWRKKRAETGSVINLKKKKTCCKKKKSCCHTKSQVFVLRSWDYGNYSEHAMSNYYSVYYQSLHLRVIKWKQSSLRKFCMLLFCTFRHLCREHTLKYVLQTDVVCQVHKNKVSGLSLYLILSVSVSLGNTTAVLSPECIFCNFGAVNWPLFHDAYYKCVSFLMLQNITGHLVIFLLRDTTVQIFTTWHFYY